MITPESTPRKDVKQPQRFQRVDPSKVAFVHDSLRDNTYKSGPSGSYGDKASNDLIITRGKGFKQEKNKKKRGSYRGGSIDSAGVSSFKFKYSDDE